MFVQAASAGGGGASASVAGGVDGAGDISIMGRRVTVIPARMSRRRRAAARWSIVCSSIDQFNCHTGRSINQDVAAFGADGTKFYFQTWLARAFEMERNEHFEWRPTNEDIQAYLVSLEEA